MATGRHLDVSHIAGTKGEVTVARFLDRRILETAAIQELGDELFALVDNEQPKNLVLNLATVEFLSSAGINKLIVLHKRVKTAAGKLRLCNLQPVVTEVFVNSMLHTVFEIKPTEKEALADF